MSEQSSWPRQFVFIDTSAFVALAISGDQAHASAATIARALRDGRMRWLTTNFVLLETHAMLVRSLGGRRATHQLLELERGALVVIRVDEQDERDARLLLLRYADRDFSLTDATSFVIMERLGIRTAFTFDRHFAQYGFTVAGEEP